jgi:hypothetical protein
VRQALRSHAAAPRATVAAVQSFPAPVGGWNARDALAAMKPTDAVELINWFPRASYVEIRGGSEDHATGMTGNGKTLAVYNALSGTNSMFAMTASGVYNVTSAGAVGASVAARTNGKHQWLMFGDGTSNWLIAVNGVDKPLYYNGTTWTAVDGVSTPALTGLTTTDIIGVATYQKRLFFLEKNSLSFWYLAAGAAGGALTEFDLSSYAKKGGYLMAMTNWTVDAGDGPNDRAVFVTSEGEIIVYIGDNPSVAANWQLVGVYDLGKPLGRRCLTKFGGDVVLITQNGAFPLAQAIQSTGIDYTLALSDKIVNAFNTAARTSGGVFGWEALVFPAQAALIVNVPTSEDGQHEQYVMNTQTKAWCRFTDWDAEDFAILNAELYFTVGTKVVKAWTGKADNGADIVSYGKSAFSQLGSPGVEKQVSMFRPMLAVNGNLSFLTDIDVDFGDTPITGTATYTVTSGALWDVDLWDESYWAASLEVKKEWTSPNENLGYWVSGKVKIATNTLTIQWMSCDYMYTKGGLKG